MFVLNLNHLHKTLLKIYFKLSSVFEIIYFEIIDCQNDLTTMPRYLAATVVLTNCIEKII